MEFQAFKKIPRLSRDIVITEKIDGTNGQIYILSYRTYINSSSETLDSYFEYMTSKAICKLEDKKDKFNSYLIFAGSKNRWLDTTSKGDNFGFAKWVQENAEELLKLGEGRHYGEWFGKGIQRGYGLEDKRFALFNVSKWHKVGEKPRLISINPKTKEEKHTITVPNCCEVVPILYQGNFDTVHIDVTLDLLRYNGSHTVPGYMNPEGIIVYHTASGQMFKKTIVGDEKPKGSKE